MRRVEMIYNGSETKWLAEHMRYEQKVTRNGATSEEQMLSKEDESRINEDNVNMELLQRAQAVVQRPQQQPQVPIVRWERFLHVRSLKVLLVENDESTRHIVSALLRKCSYEVTAVANGIQACKILDDLTNHIDLVLTEVVMPVMSGLGLLGKIMSHQTCKNIPVIMMSSHDSMGIVFKCLSKGAVDFLVKPIRKNELKNIWQHVWRKCHSSSGSGSESGIRTQKSAKMISADESDKSGSNDGDDDDKSISLSARDGSDHGSGTQSSWTKRAVEVDSPQAMSEWCQLADDPPDSACAQANYSGSRPEVLTNNLESMTAPRKRQQQDDELDNAAMGNYLAIGVPKNSDLQLQRTSAMIINNTVDTHAHKFSEVCSKKDDEEYVKGKAEHNSDTPNGNLRNQSSVLMDFIANSSGLGMESSKFQLPNDFSSILEIKDKEIPSLELSLKSLGDIEDNGTIVVEQNNWRPSSISAFSRYNSASTTYMALTGNVGSSSPLNNSSVAMLNLISDLDSAPPNQHSNSSCNNNDMGSTTNNVSTTPVEFNDGSLPKITVNIRNPSSAFQAVQNGHISHQPNTPTKADSAVANTVVGQGREMNQQVQVHHSLHLHHHHHHHHLVHKSSQHEQQPTLNMMAVASPQCGSSNVWRCNGKNGSSIPVSNGAMLMNVDTDVAKNGGASGNESRSGTGENQARRVAALNKFRQKRKERCFEKKVRYQSRKRLAEQRPRVRGQFVRLVAQENKSKDTGS